MRRPNATEEVIQEVAMLSAAGHSLRQIQDMTSIPDSTVHRWVHREDVGRLIKERTEQLALAYSERMMRRYDATEDNEKFLTGSQLPIDYGIILDKYSKLSQSQSDSRIQSGIVLILGDPRQYIRDQRDVIEGQATEILESESQETPSVRGVP